MLLLLRRDAIAKHILTPLAQADGPRFGRLSACPT